MATTAPMHKNRTTTLGRISGFLNGGGLFSNVNLPAKLYPESRDLTSLTWLEIQGPHDEWQKDEWKFSEIINKTFSEKKIGDWFGKTWTTHWFKILIDVPTSWTGKEVHLRWNSSSEAAIYDTQGRMLQGLSPGFREEFILSRSWEGSTQQITYYIEMACNDMFGSGNGDLIAPTNNDRYFQLNRADIAVYDRQIYKLHTDLDILNQIANQLSNDHRGYQAMDTANEMVTLIQTDNDLEKASQIADVYFSEGNGKKAHTLVTMGHCHIDTAWLWPYEETMRKIGRSWMSQIGLMKEYPEYVFTCSSAQQYEWLNKWYPDVFAQVKDYVEQGRFIPVGGTWIENDGNIPSGEAFLRQFFYGQRYFKENFGLTCKEFWLPDTFGYSAQIPQLLRHIGIGRFLTQKMSWSLVNKFPHHNFWWEGIDGSEVLVHFPPGDSYNMNGTVSELLYSVNNSQDKGRANTGIYLYGYGDGGGGPTRSMIERQKRVQDVDGMPKLVFEGPDYFFKELEKESNKLSKWVGELYLELHNGTYTSQAKIKWFNRKSEFFLRELEHLATIARVTNKISGADYEADKERIDRCWKNVLLNQFHDILPGSSIELANQVAWKYYEETWVELNAIRKKYNDLILGNGTTARAIFNPLPWEVKTVIFNKLDSGTQPAGPNIQEVDLKSAIGVENGGEGQFRVPNQFSAALVTLAPSGYTTFDPQWPLNTVVYTAGATGAPAQYSNGLVRLEVSKTGIPYEELYFTGPSKVEQKVFGDRLNTGTRGGHYYIYDDIPLYWDAWDVMDYHLETRRFPKYTENTPFEDLTGAGRIVGISKFTGTFNNSKLERYTIIRADSPLVEYYTIIDWKENRKMLKVEFPVDILSREATYEIQFGNAKRPTHINTSWDMAKFEVCGHKWMDISQADKGVTIITDSKYGWNVRDNIVRLSLLKSPKNPDANADMHKHYIYYAVLPHEGSFQESEVIRRAYELNVLGANNVPLIPTGLTALPNSIATSTNPAVIIEALKPAHDIQNAVVIRLYEAHGGSATATIQLGGGLNATKVQVCDGLEAPGVDVPVSNNSFSTTCRPFEIQSFLVTF
ncbi:unnamed protein product [Allacma fusca]|uniref:alpha-mannosidase n=1 Tax=Allacma fusca TaxID=39272 RepID=A0A8J2PCI5_9HEXA|nr:unnamed protein product [Allacma fusca]